MIVFLRSAGAHGHTKVVTVPADIARAVPDNAAFEPEFTDEGILFRFAGFRDREPWRRPTTAVVPDWAQGNGSAA